jgi:hypothetical protein
MADPTPDVAIIVYPTEDELRRCGSQVEPIHGINIHLPSEYLEALQAYTDAVVAKVLLGVTIPEGWKAPRLSLDCGQPPVQSVSPVNGSTEPAPRDDMSETWREIMGEELGGES